MATCFCGCGTKVSFAMRPVNTRGKRIVQEVAKVEKLRAQLGYSPTLTEYAEDGMTIAGEIAETIHSGERPSDELESASAGWRAAGRRYTTAGFGAAISNSGMSDDEAIAEIRAGRWDPFAE